MGLLNVRNLRKAKNLLEKNRHKVGGAVQKAGGTLDKVSKGKTSSMTAKAADAAQKYSSGGSTNYGRQVEVDANDVHTHQAQSQAASQAEVAGAVKGAADAFTNFVNKAAKNAEDVNAERDKARKSPDPE